MYNFIFYTLYKYNLKSGAVVARIEAIMVVALALMFHIGFLLAIIKKLVPHFYEASISNSLPKDKGFGLLIISIIGIGVYFWFNKLRIKKLLAKRKPIPETVTNSWDILYVVLLLLIPIVTILIVFWKR